MQGIWLPVIVHISGELKKWEGRQAGKEGRKDGRTEGRKELHLFIYLFTELKKEVLSWEEKMQQAVMFPFSSIQFFPPAVYEVNI